MTASSSGGNTCLTAKGLDISLAALQRQDPYINNIVDVASQVALYTFNNRSNEWEKTDVEGTLFVYTRYDGSFTMLANYFLYVLPSEL
uniref:5'-(N(7)-methylguanosine 5'-triphospho)-[mRNA] hydrolase n=1 Tax=Hucho hucho TaxID=62062 RepID=A0A4W5PXR0_9TELE